MKHTFYCIQVHLILLRASPLVHNTSGFTLDIYSMYSIIICVHVCFSLKIVKLFKINNLYIYLLRIYIF